MQNRIGLDSDEAVRGENAQVQYASPPLWQSSNWSDNSLVRFNRENHDVQSQRNAEIPSDLIRQAASYSACPVSSDEVEPCSFATQTYNSYFDNTIAATPEPSSSKHCSDILGGIDNNSPYVLRLDLSSGESATGEQRVSS